MRTQITHNKFLAALILAFFVFGFNVQDALSQNSNNDAVSTATVKETLEWLKISVNKEGKVFMINRRISDGGYDPQNYDSVEQTYELTEFNGCNVTFRTSTEEKTTVNGKSKDIRNSEETGRFSLGDLDLGSIKVTGGTDLEGPIAEITAFTYQEKNVIKYTSKNSAGKESNGNAFHFRILLNTGKDKRDRIVRAFKHAITLCGGKVEPF